MRAAVPLLLAVAAAAAEAPQPLPTLPPEPRTLQLTPGGQGQGGGAAALDRKELAADLQALRRAVERVETALRQDPGLGAAGASHDPHAPAGHAQASAHGPAGGTEEPSEPVASPQFGIDRLSLRRHQDGTHTVTAAISGEPAEVVAKEICTLAGLRLDLRDAGGVRRPVSLHVKDLLWRDALDRVLGQIGLSWQEESSGGQQRVVVGEGPAEGSEAERSAGRALDRAAAERSGAVAAEALYLLARRDLDAGHPAEAMRRFNDLVEGFAEERDQAVRAWVQRSVRGIGECMVQLKQYREARSVFRNYISRASVDDPELPRVYLRAAEAGRRLGVERNDPVALDEAVEDLHAMLERFAGKDRAKDPPEVAVARLMIGGLLFDARRWQDADTQLRLYRAAAGDRRLDQVDYWIAECTLQLGRSEEARELFERLYSGWRANRTDGLAPAAIYPAAAYRIGICFLRTPEPRYVHALFAFQRAVRDFPRAEVDAEVAVSMAACYAQIEREDKAVEELFGLLKADTGGDGSTGRLQLDKAVGTLMARLGDQPGSVRARAYFYIAQAAFRRAERDRSDRTALAAQSVGYYERVLAENPPADMRDAARLGLARAALLAGNEERGLAELRRLRADPATQARDREFANRLLGEHYRAKGQTREAIRAFRGEGDGAGAQP